MAQASTEPISIEFGSGINPDHAERVIKILGEDEAPSRKVILRFETYPYVNPGVGWRIGNSLRRFSGGLLEVSVPPFLDGQREWFRSFTRSCLGDAIAAHAGTILCDGVDIAQTVRDYYNKHSVRSSQNAVVLGALHRGLTVNPEREDLFRDLFLGSLPLVNVRPIHFELGRLQDILKLTFEAIQNVYDHAERSPLSPATKIISYALLRYYKSVGPNHPDPCGRLKEYIARLPLVARRKRTDFIEVCVNDDGVGIAARQSQSRAIYWGSTTEEQKALCSALMQGSSVKLRAQDARIRGKPGEGYTYIDSSLKALRAFCVLRTGRILAVLDGTDDSVEGFAIVPADLGYMPGTTLDVLIPILKDGDAQQSLFPDE